MGKGRIQLIAALCCGAAFAVARGASAAGAFPLRVGTAWQDDTVYVADGRDIEVRLADTLAVDDDRYKLKGFTNVLSTAFFLKGRKNVTLDFAGATLTLHGKIQPFLLDRCENVTVKNVTVRYDRCGYTQGEVVSIDRRVIRLRVDRGKFPYRIEHEALIFHAATWTGGRIDREPCFTQFFDGATRRGKAMPLAFFAPDPYVDPSIPWAAKAFRFTAAEKDGVLELTSAADMWIADVVRSGDVMVIAHEPRTFSSCLMRECRNVGIVNYRILNGTGMGIFPFHCENILIDGFKVFCDERSPSIIGNSADAIHAFSCSGDFTVRNSVVEGTIDDALNVHGNFYQVKSVRGNVIVADTGSQPFADTAVFLPGDRIRVCRGHTLETAGEYRIVSLRKAERKAVEMTLDRPVGDHAPNDAIENMSAQCRLTISNCRFGKANSHLRLQTRGGILVENCESELPLRMTGDMTYWFESSPCERAVFRNVVFRTDRGRIRATPEFEATEAAPYYHGDIVVESCSFESETAIDLHRTRSLTVCGCRQSAGLPLKAILTDCGTADSPGWTVLRKSSNPVLRNNGK